MEKMEQKMELTTQVLTGTVEGNFQELKGKLELMMQDYTNTVYTGEDALKKMKEDRASLSRLQKQIQERKVAVKKSYMVPLEEFEAGVAELLAIIEKPRQLIDKNVKRIEKELREIRRKDIQEYYQNKAEESGLCVDAFCEELLSRIWSDKWLNANTPKKEWKLAIENAVDNYMQGVSLLVSMNEPDFLLGALETFQRTLIINEGVSYINAKRTERAELERAKAEAEARAKAEAEARAKAELERAKAEAEARAKAELERAKAEAEAKARAEAAAKIKEVSQKAKEEAEAQAQKNITRAVATATAEVRAEERARTNQIISDMQKKQSTQTAQAAQTIPVQQAAKTVPMQQTQQYATITVRACDVPMARYILQSNGIWCN